MMDTWESFFRQKSRRRLVARNGWALVGWALASLALAAAVAGMVELVSLAL